MAKKVERCLNQENEDEAIKIVSENKVVLKWRDEEGSNWTLIHKAARFAYCNTFLEAIFGDEKVFIIS